MSEFFQNVWAFISNSISLSVFDIIDIAIMWFAIYQILKFFKNTRAMNVLKGIAILIVALAVASWIQLPTVTWLLSSVFTSGIVIIVILKFVSDLFNLEQEVQIYTINIDALGDMVLSMRQMEALMFMID